MAGVGGITPEFNGNAGGEGVLEKVLGSRLELIFAGRIEAAEKVQVDSEPSGIEAEGSSRPGGGHQIPDRLAQKWAGKATSGEMGVGDADGGGGRTIGFRARLELCL